MRLQRTQRIKLPRLASPPPFGSLLILLIFMLRAWLFFVIVQRRKKAKKMKENKAKNANVLDAQANKRIYIFHTAYTKSIRTDV